MKNQIIIKIIKDWEKINNEEKLKLLQSYENANAKFQKRKERKIVFWPKLKSDECAEYKFFAPSSIYIKSLDTTAFEALSSIFHEGFHAMCDDYFNSKSDIVALTSIDENQLKLERMYIDIIHNRAFHEGKSLIFSLKYYEETLVRRETALYLLYNILNACEELSDCLELFNEYQQCFGIVYSYETYVNTLNANTEYKRIIDIAINKDSSLFEDKIKCINTSRMIQYKKESEKLRDFFEKNYTLFEIIQNEENEEIVKSLSAMFAQNFLQTSTSNEIEI